MVTAVAVVSSVLIIGCLVLLAVHLARGRSERRFEQALHHVESRLQEISTSVTAAMDHLTEMREKRPTLPLTLDLDALAEALVAEAAGRTGADAAVLRVEGPGQRPVIASFGQGVETEALEGPFRPPDARAFRAATIGWTYPSTEEPEEHVFRSSLAVPVTDGSGGALAVYAKAADAFRSEHATELQALVDEAAVALANARRFGEVEARMFIDPATGVRDRRAYELELERKIAHARRTGRPLSVLLVALARQTGSSTQARSGNGVGEFARLLRRVTRGSDVSCRRGESEFAILLPETPETGATRLTSRLREEARRTFGSAVPSTFTVGLAEWRPDEPGEALEARAAAALARPLAAITTVGSGGRPDLGGTRGAGTDELRSEMLSDRRLDALDALTTAISDVRRLGRPLVLAVLDIDMLEEIAERHGQDVADAVLDDVVEQLDRSVEDGVVHRLGPSEFALVLAGSTVDGAEVLLGAVQSSLDPPRNVGRLTLSAGLTEFEHGDDARAMLDRAERALRQATRVGPGTLVIGHPGSRTS